MVGHGKYGPMAGQCSVTFTSCPKCDPHANHEAWRTGQLPQAPYKSTEPPTCLRTQTTVFFLQQTSTLAGHFLFLKIFKKLLKVLEMTTVHSTLLSKQAEEESIKSFHGIRNRHFSTRANGMSQTFLGSGRSPTSSFVFLDKTRSQSPIILRTAAKQARPTRIQNHTNGLYHSRQLMPAFPPENNQMVF